MVVPVTGPISANRQIGGVKVDGDVIALFRLVPGQRQVVYQMGSYGMKTRELFLAEFGAMLYLPSVMK